MNKKIIFLIIFIPLAFLFAWGSKYVPLESPVSTKENSWKVVKRIELDANTKGLKLCTMVYSYGERRGLPVSYERKDKTSGCSESVFYSQRGFVESVIFYFVFLAGIYLIGLKIISKKK